MKDYYNTNKETGATLRASRQKAKTQQYIILEHFQINKGRLFTTSQVKKILFEGRVPITSIQRAITNLTDDNKLVKTNIMRIGPYGKQVHCWRLAREGEINEISNNR